MNGYTILWADDEIDLLKPHILFLQQKGYIIVPINNGFEAVELSASRNFDIIFLDENMPGMSGLEALDLIKSTKPNVPVVMITKHEEEQIMDDAIGAQIEDYLIKPLNHKQILLAVKKILDKKHLVMEKVTSTYQQEFSKINMAILDNLSHEEWADIYKKIVHWELKINQSDAGMLEVLGAQKEEANLNFCRFIKRNYESWLNDPNSSKPLMSHKLMKAKVFPEVNKSRPTFMFVIDNFRFDQWKIIESELLDYFAVDSEETYYSILPTTTAYSRNSLFSGMLPSEMYRVYPELWVSEEEDDGKNNFEHEFLEKQLQRNNLKHKFSYNKILKFEEGRIFSNHLSNLFSNDLNVIVFNFVDMLSHARSDMNMIMELTPDEAAYRSITKSWFAHSSLFEILKKISEIKARVIITTDHGTIRVKRPFKIIGDRNVNTNLRYKQGRNLNYSGDKILATSKPERFFLPKGNVSTSYVFAIEDQFFAYPNNFNQYVSMYKDTFQHGGVSLEEMIIPLVFLTPKNVLN